MLRRGVVVRSRFLLVAVLIAGAATPTLGASAACAGTGDRAGLVVDTGENTFTYCVSLTDDSVSGLELIQLANAQHGLQYRFGDGGQAVCMLANIGAEGDDCFGEYPDFWGYWRGDGNGGWTWSSVGAGSTLVRDGDIQGWSWGSGQDGTTHPNPPPTRHEDVCPPEASPPKDREQSAGARPNRPDPHDKSAEPEPDRPPAPNQRRASDRTEEPSQKSDVPKERLTPRTATASDRAPEAVSQAAAHEDAAAQEETGEGPPQTALLATALIAALATAGAITMKRRRS